MLNPTLPRCLDHSSGFGWGGLNDLVKNLLTKLPVKSSGSLPQKLTASLVAPENQCLVQMNFLLGPGLFSEANCWFQRVFRWKILGQPRQD